MTLFLYLHFPLKNFSFLLSILSPFSPHIIPTLLPFFHYYRSHSVNIWWATGLGLLYRLVPSCMQLWMSGFYEDIMVRVQFRCAY
jgi:hypothetical protein